MKSASIVSAALMMLTAPSVAIAEERLGAWEFAAGAAYVVLGGKHTTGGLMPSLVAHRSIVLSERWDARVGVQGGAFGFADDPHWIGFLAGPSVGARVRPWPRVGVGFGADFDLDLGRIPIVNDWGLPLRYWGLFPALGINASYTADKLWMGGGGLRARYVSTLGWEGVSWEGHVNVGVHL